MWNIVCQYKVKEREILQGVYTYHIAGLGTVKHEFVVRWKVSTFTKVSSCYLVTYTQTFKR